MTNSDIAAALEKIATLLTMTDANPFRIRAYDRAAQMITAHDTSLAELYEAEGLDGLEELPGIGKDLALKIEEMVKTGEIAYLKELQASVPKGILEIIDIEGMGPKRTQFVWKTFGVENIDDLEALAKGDKLRTQKGWGEKSVNNILLGIAARRQHSGRVLMAVALETAEELIASLRDTGLCSRLSIAGSLRRMKETTGDIDILVCSEHVDTVMEHFTTHPLVVRILAKGETKASVHLSIGIDADLRVVPEEVFGAALHYFTGSKEHNVALRQRALKRGVTISEWGVYEGTAKDKGKLLASKTEEDVFKVVGLPYIPPQLREGRGEIDAAEKDALPVLIQEEDLRGNMHMHTEWSDGKATMIEMAEAAKELGYAYIAITDHASAIGVVGGIKTSNYKQYLAGIEDARAAVKGIHIFSGCEVDIMPDGSLYLPDDVLRQFDWVNASIHGHFKQTKAEMTVRIVRALEHPHVTCLSHPTARRILKRDPIDLDMDAVIAAAKKHGKALEINASAERLDLNDIHAKRAKDRGVKLCISSDAHTTGGLRCTYGIGQAQRGWIEKDDVVNTLPLKKVQEWLKK